MIVARLAEVHGSLFFLLERDEESQLVRIKSASPSRALRLGWRRSCVTSSPSAAEPPRRFDKEHANARAVVQDKMAAHLARHVGNGGRDLT